MINIDILEITDLIKSGYTIKQLQEKYNCSRTFITDYKRKHNLVGLSPNSKKLDRDLGEKLCNCCNKIMPLSMFYSNGKTSTGKIKYKPNCKLCENTTNLHSFYSLVDEYLSTIGSTYSCNRCGITGQIGFLDFHHTNPSEKLFNIGSIPKSISTDYFIDTVIPELQKCILLCPNCHRQEHLLMGQI